MVTALFKFDAAKRDEGNAGVARKRIREALSEN